MLWHPCCTSLADLTSHGFRYAEETTDAADSLPHPAALHPALPGPDRFRLDEEDMRSASYDRDDYTVLPMDLSRYASRMAHADSLPLQRPSSFMPLPAEFRGTANAAAAAQAAGEDDEGGIPEIVAPTVPAAATRQSQDEKHQQPSSGSPPERQQVHVEAEPTSGAGPLAGIHIVRTTSHAAGLGDEFDDEEEEAGPMHFA